MSAVTYTHGSVYRIDLEPNCAGQLFRQVTTVGIRVKVRIESLFLFLFYAIVWHCFLEACAIIRSSRASDRVLLGLDFLLTCSKGCGDRGRQLDFKSIP